VHVTDAIIDELEVLHFSNAHFPIKRVRGASTLSSRGGLFKCRILQFNSRLEIVLCPMHAPSSSCTFAWVLNMPKVSVTTLQVGSCGYVTST